MSLDTWLNALACEPAAARPVDTAALRSRSLDDFQISASPPMSELPLPQMGGTPHTADEVLRPILK